MIMRMLKQMGTAAAIVGVLAISNPLSAEEKHKAGTDKSSPAAAPSMADEILQLKTQLAEQQREIAGLLAKQSKQVQGVQDQAASPAAARPATAALAPPRPVQPAQAAEQSSPLQFKIGDASVTPVGFMDLTNTFRSTNAGSSLQTNFGSIPYNNVLTGRLTEDKLSVANSRIGFRVDARVRDANVMGYYEGDFVGGVGNGANNTQVSSNSLLYRIRLYWVDIRKGKFEMLAGQSWSMITPNRKQISALPGDLFYSQVVDVNYMNGLTWGRIPGIRFLYHPSNKVTMGVSLENAAQYFGGSGGGGTPTLPALLAAPIAPELDQNVANGVATPNVHPDIIAKAAFDPGSRVHFEVAGVESTVKLFNPLTQASFTKAGGGGSLNGNFELVKNFRVVTNNFWSDGEGRYLFGVAPNFIVRADGSPSMIHSGSTVSGFEYQRKNTQLYSYYGGIYIKRNADFDANGTTRIGYGYAGSPNSHNKTTQEGTLGLTQTLWRDGKYGALQMMFQYAYLFRNPWNAAAGTPRNTHENAAWFNLRYVLPGTAPTIKY